MSGKEAGLEDPLDVTGLVDRAGSEGKGVAGTGLRCDLDQLLAIEEVGPELIVESVDGETGLGVGVVFGERICRRKTER